MNEPLTEAEIETLATLERTVFAMRLPMLLLGASAVLVGLAIVFLSLVGGGVAGLVFGGLFVLFLGLPSGLLVASGSVAMGARYEPERLARATLLQTLFWWLVLAQSAGVVLLLSASVALLFVGL